MTKDYYELFDDPCERKYKRLYQQYIILRKLLENIEYALSPDIVFDTWLENYSKVMRPTDVQGEAMLRCNSALKLIHNYRTGKRT